jgi:hypothetical protein
LEESGKQLLALILILIPSLKISSSLRDILVVFVLCFLGPRKTIVIFTQVTRKKMSEKDFDDDNYNE